MCVAYMYFSIPQPCTLYAYLSHPIGVSLEPSFPNLPPYVMHKYTRARPTPASAMPPPPRIAPSCIARREAHACKRASRAGRLASALAAVLASALPFLGRLPPVLPPVLPCAPPSCAPSCLDLRAPPSQVLRSLNHKNIIKLYEIFEEDGMLLMIMELCCGTYHDAALLRFQVLRLGCRV